MSRSTDSGVTDFGLFWLRVLAGLGMVYHGYGKVFGDMSGLIKGVEAMGFPYPAVFAWAAAMAEFAGGIMLVVGLCTRSAATLIFITMSVAAFVTHGGDPFSKKELALAYWTMAGALVFTGAGKISIDHLIYRK